MAGFLCSVAHTEPPSGGLGSFRHIPMPRSPASLRGGDPSCCCSVDDISDDFKPMPVIGPGVEELRVWDSSGIYRVIYTARLSDAVYVLHAFQKTTPQTAKADLDLARERFSELRSTP